MILPSWSAAAYLASLTADATNQRVTHSNEIDDPRPWHPQGGHPPDARIELTEPRWTDPLHGHSVRRYSLGDLVERIQFGFFRCDNDFSTPLECDPL